MPPKLHELLAVKDNLRSQAETCRNDLKGTFEKRTQHFTERVTTYNPKAENELPKTEESVAMQTTVSKELKWIQEKLVKAIDVNHQIEVSNCSATADVILDNGALLLTGMPSASLLQLQKRLMEIVDLVKAIPTLDPAKGFQPDKDKGAGIYRANETVRDRTHKEFKFVVMVPANDKHPAQVEKMNVDVPVGVLTTQEWSSLISVADKAEMLDRAEHLLRAVKKATARANEREVQIEGNRIGDRVLDYIFSGRQ